MRPLIRWAVLIVIAYAIYAFLIYKHLLKPRVDAGSQIPLGAYWPGMRR